MHLELAQHGVSGPDDFEPAFRAMVEQQRVGALIEVPAVLFSERRRELADLAIKARLPTMLGARSEVEAGGLMTYVHSYSDMYRRAAAYVVKILKGAKPADLPVEQPTKFELVVNLKTMRELGLTISRDFLLLTDEVVE